jgi:transposase
VLGIRVWAMLLGVVRAVVEGVEMDDEGSIIVAARPRRRERNRCGICGRRSPGYDQGEGRRRWRALDVGLATADIEAGTAGDLPGTRCGGDRRALGTP